ncbi:hypothetical protein RY27_25730 [Litorilinea aerophila]|nr:hypothetical protein RY27_25730 [Litorilinea aerophila]
MTFLEIGGVAKTGLSLEAIRFAVVGASDDKFRLRESAQHFGDGSEQILNTFTLFESSHIKHGEFRGGIIQWERPRCFISSRFDAIVDHLNGICFVEHMIDLIECSNCCLGIGDNKLGMPEELLFDFSH